MRRLLLLGLGFACTSVLAHPVFENTIADRGIVFKAELMITHGCGDSPTKRLIIDIPEDVLAVTPRLMADWTIETVESNLSAPRKVFGMERTKYTSQIIWSGNELSSDYFDVFSFILILPTEAAKLYFPTTQECVEGVDAYTTIPDPDNDEYIADEAPSLTIVPSAGGGDL
jgi:uncharacterized protein YcnI